ncbi:hypothetical protein E4N62_25410 [Streptomyces sp. MNU76]|uniref:hypothetical protein n=1 Tax=Streptomyces sp. MNU76 TaxID=2560026 RepID=UPI001E5D70FD|nr:hypothetical protein [Streptomyces sp. MNU76]MCC9708306.1 hypothetical protein [Streptomyces sp. MNU76]
MSFDEAWGQARGAAAARQENNMQLNLLPADGGGSNTADLKTNALGKTVAIKLLQPDGLPLEMEKAGRHVEENSGAAAREFTDWETGTGLKDAYSEWKLQIKSLKSRLEGDREALTGIKRDFQYLGLAIQSEIAQIRAGSDPKT